jgi:hypothetical protein
MERCASGDRQLVEEKKRDSPTFCVKNYFACAVK